MHVLVIVNVMIVIVCVLICASQLMYFLLLTSFILRGEEM